MQHTRSCLLNLPKTFNFWQTFSFWQKHSISDKIINFWQKHSTSDKNIQLLTKTFNFWQKQSTSDKNIQLLLLNHRCLFNTYLQHWYVIHKGSLKFAFIKCIKIINVCEPLWSQNSYLLLSWAAHWAELRIFWCRRCPGRHIELSWGSVGVGDVLGGTLSWVEDLLE